MAKTEFLLFSLTCFWFEYLCFSRSCRGIGSLHSEHRAIFLPRYLYYLSASYILCLLYSASCILYPVSCILYPVSCILYPISCILYPVSCIMYPLFCILYPVSCILYHVSSILHLVSCILYPTSHIPGSQFYVQNGFLGVLGKISRKSGYNCSVFR